MWLRGNILETSDKARGKLPPAFHSADWLHYADESALLRCCVHLTRGSTLYWFQTGLTGSRAHINSGYNICQRRGLPAALFSFFCSQGVNVIFILCTFPFTLSQHNTCHSSWWMISTFYLILYSSAAKSCDQVWPEEVHWFTSKVQHKQIEKWKLVW